MPELARYDAATVFEVLDAAQFCHLAGVVDDRAMVLATLFVRDGRRLYLHGSRSSALLAAVLDSGEACVSVAIYDGVRLARSGFETSVAYRSVVAFGRVRAVTDLEAARALDLFVDSLVPGRLDEVRPITDQERRLTLVVAFEIDEASVKLSAGPTSDESVDAARSIWSGIVPNRTEWGAPIPFFDGAMATGSVPLASSVRRLCQRPEPDLVERLRGQIDDIDPVDEREAMSIGALRDRLGWSQDLFDETTDPRHLTASAFVVSRHGVILHRHRHLGIWVQPGGHVDHGETPDVAAIREVREETGLTCQLSDPDQIFHVDLHQGPRGHTHYDLRYVAWSDGSPPSPPPGESPDVAWFRFDEAAQRAEPALRAALGKLEQFVRRSGRATLEP